MRDASAAIWSMSFSLFASFGCDAVENGELDGDIRVDSGADSGASSSDGSPPDEGSLDDGAVDSGTADDGSRSCRLTEGECDLLRQDCPAEDACRWVMPAGDEDGDLTALCEPGGTIGVGQACTRPNCASGLVCVEGFCREYCCDGENGDCSAGSICVPTGRERQVGFCLPDTGCDPLDGSGCEEGQACYLTRGGGTCFDAGSVAFGEACGRVNDCVPGGVCANRDDGEYICRQACMPAMRGADCANPDTETCQRISSAGTSELGVCSAP